MAERCPATCCAGWHIEIDDESWKRFHELPDGKLRGDVLQNIYERSGRYFFKNRPDGRCQMLEEDGRCLIWRKAGEQALCMTCRKYPALISRAEEDVYISMAASCPVVARYLWKDRVGWTVREGRTVTWENPWQDQSWRDQIFQSVYRYGYVAGEDAGRTDSQDGQDVRCDSGDNPERLKKERLQRIRKHYQSVYDLVAGCTDLIVSSPEIAYLAGCFDYFEADVSAVQIIKDLQNFEETCRVALNHFYDNYIPYRVYSRYLEYPAEEENDRVFRIFGEAALFYLVHFSRFHVFHGQEDGRAEEEIAWLYRFTVHSRRREAAFLQMLKAAFTDVDDLADVFRADR